MRKDEFAEKLSKKVDMPKTKAVDCIDAIFSTDPRQGIIATELDAGRSFTITGFGTFDTRRRKQRKGRNPQTGEEITIPAMTVPTFRASSILKRAVRGERRQERLRTYRGSVELENPEESKKIQESIRAVHVLPTEEGKWQVFLTGANGISEEFATKEAAVGAAKELAEERRRSVIEH